MDTSSSVVEESKVATESCSIGEAFAPAEVTMTDDSCVAVSMAAACARSCDLLACCVRSAPGSPEAGAPRSSSPGGFGWRAPPSLSMPKSSSRMSARPPSQENSSRLIPVLLQWPSRLFWWSMAASQARSTRWRRPFIFASSSAWAEKVLSTARRTSARLSRPLLERFQYLNHSSLFARSGRGPSALHRRCSVSCRQAQA
mmetsp:Transcript_23276/g.69302  ORF Transcript_23276/g.69302 Transcript_23276/m.69302 type:complete len:200 (-) Transcript_23276:391-990(-)